MSTPAPVAAHGGYRGAKVALVREEVTSLAVPRRSSPRAAAAAVVRAPRRPPPQFGYGGFVRGGITAAPAFDRTRLAAVRTALSAARRPGAGAGPPPGRSAWILDGAGVRVDGWTPLGALAEWLVVLGDVVQQVAGSRLTGRVEVQGEVAGDRWTLSAGEAGVTVERRALPCPPCWTDVLKAAVPSSAYRFRHPVPEANLAAADDRFRPPAWDADRARWEVACADGGWTPLRRCVRVRWPRPVGGEPGEPWWLQAP